MRRLTKKQIFGALLGVALVWVCLMSISVGSGHATARRTSSFQDDGSIKAEITRLENQNFEISLSIRVLDANGKVVGGLSDREIEVTEDGQPVAIKDFVTAGQQSVRTILVLDHSGSMAGDKLQGAKNAAVTFIDLMRDHVDHLGILFFQSTIREVLPIGSMSAANRAVAQDAVHRLDASGGTHLFEALEQALHGMVGTSGRRLILCLTDGQDDKRDRKQMERIIDRAKELNVPLYMIGLGSDVDERVMGRLAQETQGQYFKAPSAEQLTEIYRSIGSSLQNEYSVTYESPNPDLDGLARNVAVTVRVGDRGTVANNRYSVRGLMNVGGSRQRPARGAQSGTAPEASRPPFLAVFLPLALVLGSLFGVPYVQLLHPDWLSRFRTPPRG